MSHDDSCVPQMTRVVFSASASYLGHAVRALGRRFPGAHLEELAPEVGRIGGPEIDLARVAAACQDPGLSGPPVPFVRHLATEDVLVPVDALDEVPQRAVQLAGERGKGSLAVQVWSSGQVAMRAPDLRAEVEAVLTGAGVATARGGQQVVLTVCLTPAGASVGLGRAEYLLADWPGGRVVLGRPRAQISRAEWKIEELFKVVGGVWPEAGGEVGEGRALDLGASPGGWTRILRTRGYEVWAVDPGDLHPAVAADSGVHHEVTTAGRFLAGTDVWFDLVVNDMRMVAERSCQVVVDAAQRLRSGGMTVVTLKVSAKRPMPTVERALRLLDRVYEPVFVRQLYHNRNEVTVVARRR